MLAFITGSGFYQYPGFEATEVQTPYGNTEVLIGKIQEQEVAILSRHGKGHKNLPHHINFKANIYALKELGADAIISFSVCGVLNPNIPLAKPIIATDLYFPDSRLGNGEMCTFFDTPGAKDRGHLITHSFFNKTLTTELQNILGSEAYLGCYSHVFGPRFYSPCEYRALAATGAAVVSQTCGPEAILTNELELPYALVCFGVDHPNGIIDTPTPPETLTENLKASTQTFQKIIQELSKKSLELNFEGFVYRFE